MASLDAGEETALSASNGQALYATEVDSWNRIAMIYIRPDANKYAFTPPLSSSSKPKVLGSLSKSKSVIVTKSAEFRDRKHPSIHKLAMHEKAAHAMSAKFRSLTSRPVDMWFEGELYISLCNITYHPTSFNI